MQESSRFKLMIRKYLYHDKTINIHVMLKSNTAFFNANVFPSSDFEGLKESSVRLIRNKFNWNVEYLSSRYRS